jgi:hypothetical protein
MNPIRIFAATLLVASAPLAHAVQPAGTLPPSRSGPGPADLIERGGTVNAVDPARHALVVDGSPYTLARGGVRIHLAGGKVTDALAQLKRGTQIRFTSVQGGSSPQPEVREIWVAEPRTR